MAAPKQNRYGVGFGRPVSKDGFSDATIVKLGKELDAWMIKCDSNNYKPCSIAEFYSIEKMILHKDWDNITKRACFIAHYERCKEWIAKNIRNNKDLHQSYGNRYLGIYDRKLNQYEEAQRDRQAERVARKDAQAHMNLVELLKDARLGKIRQQDTPAIEFTA